MRRLFFLLVCVLSLSCARRSSLKLSENSGQTGDLSQVDDCPQSFSDLELCQIGQAAPTVPHPSVNPSVELAPPPPQEAGDDANAAPAPPVSTQPTPPATQPPPVAVAPTPPPIAETPEFGVVATWPIYRLYHEELKDHHYTQSYEEVLVAQSEWGYRYDGIAFNLAQEYSPRCPQPVVRCLMIGKWNHFLSADLNCEGHTSEGAIGYACYSEDDQEQYFPGQTVVSVTPLYRAYHSETVDHITSGWIEELEQLPNYGWTVYWNVQFWAPI